MRTPKDFFSPLALGAPQPLREIPFRPSRMIHFFDPSNEKMRSKIPAIAPTVDVLLGNLEDAVAVNNKAGGHCGPTDRDKLLKELSQNISIPIISAGGVTNKEDIDCLLYTSPSPRDATLSRMPSSA